MLHLSTVDSTTLELLKKLQSIPILHNTRLVGGTALALQIGHRKSVDLDFFGTVDASKDELTMALDFYSQKYPDGSTFMAMKCLAYFDDAEEDIMPYMLTDISWEKIKSQILSEIF